MRTRSATTRAILFVGAVALLPFASLTAADVITVPTDYSTIQKAINAASNGDEILVKQGDYLEHLDFLGKAITVQSGDPTDPDIVASTRIVGTSYLATVTCASGEGHATILSGFTITHEAGTIGVGMEIRGAAPTISYCVFTLNDNNGHGGGIYSWMDAQPSVNHCAFTHNDALDGGGLYHAGGGDITVRHSVFYNNNASSVGGGIYNKDGSPTITDCRFQANQTGLNGGGVYNTDGDLTLTDCEFLDNDAYRGGGVYAINSTLNLIGCEFSGNTASSSFGGGIMSFESELIFDDCTFAGDPDDTDFTIDSVAGKTWSHEAPPTTLTGACCFTDFCIVATEADCLAAGGTYMGDDTTCADITCPGPCLGDLNGDGLRDQSDLGLLLASYEVDGGGDLNDDCLTDQADLGLFLAVYEVPCP
jgi:Chlamydia polymorphic membrane protein (Chlamydia_PMP) repeat